MDSVPMPRDLSEGAVAAWVASIECGTANPVPELVDSYRDLARAVRALLREKVRECIAVTESRYSMPRFAPKDKAYGSIHPGATDDEIIARVMGEEAPRA